MYGEDEDTQTEGDGEGERDRRRVPPSVRNGRREAAADNSTNYEHAHAHTEKEVKRQKHVLSEAHTERSSSSSSRGVRKEEGAAERDTRARARGEEANNGEEKNTIITRNSNRKGKRMREREGLPAPSHHFTLSHLLSLLFH